MTAHCQPSQRRSKAADTEADRTTARATAGPCPRAPLQAAARQAYHEAVTQLTRRGDAAGALRSLEAARALERGSPVAERAAALALRARARLGDGAAFERAARDYELRFPTGSARPWIERTRARRSAAPE